MDVLEEKPSRKSVCVEKALKDREPGRSSEHSSTFSGESFGRGSECLSCESLGWTLPVFVVSVSRGSPSTVNIRDRERPTILLHVLFPKLWREASLRIDAVAELSPNAFKTIRSDLQLERMLCCSREKTTQRRSTCLANSACVCERLCGANRAKKFVWRKRTHSCKPRRRTITLI